MLSHGRRIKERLRISGMQEITTWMKEKELITWNRWKNGEGE